MADPELISPSRPRQGARRRRKHARHRALGVVATLLGLALAGLWFTDTIRLPSGQGPHLAGSSPAPRRLAGDDTGSPPTATTIRRALTPDQPLRLWIAGDSLAGSLGPSLGEMTATTGVVQPQYDSRVSSGLTNPSFFNWPRHAAEQLRVLNPEAVVFIIGTNDANVWDDSQAARYALLTEQMMKLLVGPGRDVYWVGAPVVRDKRFEANVRKVDEIQRAVARKVRHVTFVDTHTLFADERGSYQSSLPDETGTRVLMRAGDGVHFSPAGGDHLAKAVFQLVDHAWNVTAQAVPGQPKPVIATRGSTQVAGTSRRSGSGSSNGTGSGGATTTTRTVTNSSSTTSPTSSTTTTTIAAATTTSTAHPPGP